MENEVNMRKQKKFIDLDFNHRLKEMFIKRRN